MNVLWCTMISTSILSLNLWGLPPHTLESGLQGYLMPTVLYPIISEVTAKGQDPE